MPLKETCQLLLTTQLPLRDVAIAQNITYNTAARYRDVLDANQLSWAVLEALSEPEIDRLLNPDRAARADRFVEPDWYYVHTESGRRGVTVTQLYNEYEEQYQENLMSERVFRRRLENYGKSLRFSMRQPRVPGERMCVDFAGDRPYYIDPQTNQPVVCELFVSVVGASHRIYAEAVPSQKLADWIGVHVNAFEFYGAITTFLVPDNLKSAVTKPCWFDGAEINPSYRALATHYGTIVLPGRPGKPKDKAPVENAVRYMQRLIRFMLRRRTFYSLAELNAGIRGLVDMVDNKPVRMFRGRSRRDMFNEVDAPAMMALRAERHEYAEWKIGLKVPVDYHVGFQQNWYSVPHGLVGRKVDVRIRPDTLQFYEAGRLVATHARSSGVAMTITNPDHQTPNHRAYAESGFSEFRDWAEQNGPNTLAYVDEHLKRANGAAAVNAYKGMRRLRREFGGQRLERACQRAVALGSISTTHLMGILQRGMESQPLPSAQAANPVPDHENVRGADYYNAANDADAMFADRHPDLPTSHGQAQTTAAVVPKAVGDE